MFRPLITDYMAALIYAFVSFILIIGLSGCQQDPFTKDLTTEMPQISDVIGTYHFEKQTLAMPELGRKVKRTTLTLYSNGSYEAQELPNIEPYNFRYLEAITTGGTWKLETIGAVENQGGIITTWGIKLNSLPESLTYIGIMNHLAPYKLIINYGDRDEGAAIILSKAKVD